MYVCLQHYNNRAPDHLVYWVGLWGWALGVVCIAHPPCAPLCVCCGAVGRRRYKMDIIDKVKRLCASGYIDYEELAGMQVACSELESCGMEIL